MAVSDFNIIKDGKSNSIPIVKAVFDKVTVQIVKDYDDTAIKNQISEIEEEVDNLQTIEIIGY